jgi:hypothetical protein
MSYKPDVCIYIYIYIYTYRMSVSKRENRETFCVTVPRRMYV